MDDKKMEQLGQIRQMGNSLNKESSKQNKSKTTNNSEAKTNHTNKVSNSKNKKASNKNKKTYSTVRITTNTSLKLHALLTASGYPNRDKLIQDMIHFAKPILLNNSSKSNKYEKTYKLLKDFRAKAKKVKNL